MNKCSNNTSKKDETKLQQQQQQKDYNSSTDKYVPQHTIQNF